MCRALRWHSWKSRLAPVLPRFVLFCVFWNSRFLYWLDFFHSDWSSKSVHRHRLDRKLLLGPPKYCSRLCTGKIWDRILSSSSSSSNSFWESRSIDYKSSGSSTAIAKTTCPSKFTVQCISIIWLARHVGLGQLISCSVDIWWDRVGSGLVGRKKIMMSFPVVAA